ncbi:hypothetical protein BU26DRAFT_301133 [Trematosphaeria pertusa]|uniref:Uncharacterized protein n=1 Tax=Trematosphaeria pertusa TaxID=390896 RepID=A0A6A6IJ55_9PLEO|nr:uncharacterized protein BU26DRAFT_301133 [Trematosphaeria pertusa]KAF2250406.1 hypothetical protein BU26DRAFT_301133 [Trematosphaeria pertusa]
MLSDHQPFVWMIIATYARLAVGTRGMWTTTSLSIFLDFTSRYVAPLRLTHPCPPLCSSSALFHRPPSPSSLQSRRDMSFRSFVSQMSGSLEHIHIPSLAVLSILAPRSPFAVLSLVQPQPNFELDHRAKASRDLSLAHSLLAQTRIDSQNSATRPSFTSLLISLSFVWEPQLELKAIFFTLRKPASKQTATHKMNEHPRIPGDIGASNIPLTPPQSPKLSLISGLRLQEEPTPLAQAAEASESPTRELQPAIQSPHSPASPQDPPNLSQSSVRSICSASSKCSNPSSLFSHASTSSSGSTSPAPPLHFYASLPSTEWGRTQHLYDSGLVFGTYDLGNGRRGGISGPSSSYYEGKYERANKEGRGGSGDSSGTAEEEGGGETEKGG